MGSYKLRTRFRRQVGVQLAAAAMALSIILGLPMIAAAACNPNQQSCSTGYGVNEVFFGTGGELHACSTGVYCAKEAAGETGVGNTAGTNYQSQAGFNTDRTPSLTFVVNATNINLGTLTAGTTATANATFSVTSYLASGYQVVTASNPPTNGSYTMQAPSTPTSSNTSLEQFGINLAANTIGCGAPANFGASPLQVPDSTFSFGSAPSNYNQCGKFMYHKGDVVAQSTKSSGETDYTISYIFNITSATPGGIYTMQHVLVATSTF